MLILLPTVTHRMQEVSDSKESYSTLRGAFLVKTMKKRWVVILAISCLFFSQAPRLSAQSTGSLKLKPDIITNDKVGNAGVGDFPIRGQLFLEKMNQTVKKKNHQDADVLRLKSDIHFGIRMDKSKKSRRENIDFLFKDYHPTVILTETEVVVATRNWIILLLVIFFVLIALLGAYLGHWWAKRRRQQRV